MTRDGRCVVTQPPPLVILSGVLIMSAFSPPLTFDTLPSAWQQALRKFHDTAPARGGGGNASWTLDEDACILHKRYNPRAQREAWPEMLIGEHPKGQGAKQRHSRYLVPEVIKAVGAVTVHDWEPPPPPTLEEEVQAAALEICLNTSFSASLPPHVRRSLVRLHAKPKRLTAQSTWTEEEDARLLAAHEQECGARAVRTQCCNAPTLVHALVTRSPAPRRTGHTFPSLRIRNAHTFKPTYCTVYHVTTTARRALVIDDCRCTRTPYVSRNM